MTNVTISELHRNLQEHLKHENEYQTRFEDKLDLILSQVTRTNGRVTALEIWKEKEAHPVVTDYKENRAQVRGATKLWTLIGGGVIIILGLTGTLYIKTLKAEILQEIKLSK